MSYASHLACTVCGSRYPTDRVMNLCEQDARPLQVVLDLERLAAEVRCSLLVDPKELRTSESVRTETARTAAAIADRMATYMSAYAIPETSNGALV